jgi:hypothetical protein
MKILVGILAVIAAVFIGVLVNYGALLPIIVVEKKEGPMTIVYLKHTGPYQTIKATMDTVYDNLMEKENIQPSRGFGLYYDNPKEAAKEKLRSLAGCILDTQDEAKADSLKQKGFTVALLPETDAIYAEFPLKGPLSILFGVFKVYPKIMDYQVQKKIPMRPVMEVYNIREKKIEYIMGYGINMAQYEELLK